MEGYLILHNNAAVTILDTEIEAILYIALNAGNDTGYRYMKIFT